VRDHAGRLTLPLDSVESRRGEAWKSYVVVACVGPPSLRDKVERAGGRRVRAGKAVDYLISALAGGSLY
jgi:hypothetical protein